MIVIVIIVDVVDVVFVVDVVVIVDVVDVVFVVVVIVDDFISLLFRDAINISRIPLQLYDIQQELTFIFMMTTQL